jgi:hypothetical protein
MKRAIGLGMVVLVAGLVGCNGFEQRWKKEHFDTSVAPLAGTWEGTWKSDKGHGEGKLRAIFVPREGATSGKGATLYEATFKSTFAKILSATHVVDITATVAPDGTWTYRGEKMLEGIGGGLYKYEGTAKGDEMSATYTAEVDRGVFTLRRAVETK